MKRWRLACGLVLLALCISQAQAARVINSVTLNGTATTTVAAGATVTISLNVSTSGSFSDDDWRSTSYTLNGSTVCADTNNFSSDGTYVASFNITAPLADGNYNISFYAHRFDNCSLAADSNNFTVNNGIVVSGGGGLVAEYFFDEEEWTGAPQEVLDNTGNGHHGTAFNGVSTGNTGPDSAISGNPGTCRYADLDGNNQYVLIADDDQLDFSSQLTVTAWIYPRSFPGGGGLFTILSKDENYEFHLNSNRQINWWWNSSGGTTQQFNSTGPQLNTDTWYHVAIVYANANQKIYINGVEQGSAGFTGGLRTNSDPVYIGTDINFIGSRNFDGPIDEVKIFSSALTAVEVQAIFTETRPCVIPVTPLLEYQFEEETWDGSAGEVVDQSGNGYNGTAQAGPSTDNTTPAIGGDPGTCRYGVFDGSNDYIAPPSSVPDLTDSFTVTGWIFADTVSGDRRIFVDDQNNSGGFGFSLGDPGSGRLRFFSRDVNPVSVDSQAAVISSGQWHFVAAVHDAINKTRKIYVDGSFVSLSGGGTESTYTGTWGSDAGPFSIGGETSLSGEYNSNFQFNGNIDELRVYQGAMSDAEIDAVMAETHPCPASLVDHYAIAVSGSGLTCEPSTVTITAHDNSHTEVAPGAGTVIALSTSTSEGTWSNPSEGSVVDNGNGDADYTFGAGSSITLSFNHPIAAAVNFDINSGSSPNEDEEPSPDFEFKNTGFRIVDGANMLLEDLSQISGKTSQQLYLQAIADDGTGLCVAAFPDNTTASIGWSIECSNPSVCIGGTQLSLAYTDGSPQGQLLNVADSGAGSFTALTMEFVTDAKTPININYPEAGVIALNTTYNVLDGDGNPTGEVITGSDAAEEVPVGFCIEAQVEGGKDPACSAPLSDCSAYVAAGDNFTLNISARASDDAGDSDYCSVGNAITQNYFSNTIALAPSLIAPVAGVNGVLSVDSAIEITSGGNVDVVETFSEVGAFTFSASDTYLGQAVDGVSDNVGRFTPAYFTLITGTDAVEPAYTDETDFTYLGQEFFLNYALAATSSLSPATVTRNYIGDFAKLDLSFEGNNPDDVDGTAVQVAYGAVNAATSLSARLVPAADSAGWVEGITTVTLLPLVLQRDSAPEAPLSNVDIGVMAEDSDGITFRPAALDLDTDLDTTDDMWQLGTHPGNFYYGRTFIPPVYGPEIPAGVETVIPFVNQYFDGNYFVTNTDDSSSGYGAGTGMNSVTLSNYRGGVDAGEVDTASTFPNPAALLLQGEADQLTVGRPGLGNSGSVDATFEVDDWLQFDWDAGSPGDENPTTRLHFGVYRSHDRIIYWREVQ